MMPPSESSRRCTPARGGAWILAAASLVLFGACRAEVGDGCTTNVECSPDGDRVCDTAQHGGYCTVAGCGAATCPEEAACVRFFPAAFLGVACDPRAEDAVDPAITPTNHCTSDEICLASGFCTLFSLERRFCMKTCASDADCRGGYECRPTGTAGAEAALDPLHPERRLTRFCAQRP